LQRRVGRLSEDSTAGYFGKRHFVHSRRFFVRCLVPFYFYNYFGLELAAASRMPERRRQAQDGSRRDCVFHDPSATSARYTTVERALVADAEPSGFCFLALAGFLMVASCHRDW